MLQIYKIKDTALPALVIDDNVLTGFHDIKDLEARIQDSFKLEATTTGATTTGVKNSAALPANSKK
jgi:hypothetical protein